MNGRIIVTGATGSMGAAAVEALAAQGHAVLMACRNLKKAKAVRADILVRIPAADILIRELDLASMSSVRRFVDDLGDEPVQALFNNAGVISKSYFTTLDGFENTFSVNYFGPWLLTRLLLPKLPADARIVNMVSLTCRYVSLDETKLRPTEREFHQLRTYARAKRALLSFSLELARRHPSLRVNLADPGVVASNMIDLGHWYDPLADLLFKPLCKTPKAGVQPALRAIAAVDGNRYYVGKGYREIPARFVDPGFDARLWAATEALISV
jgi:NAD(P)-dependent dehydrogenase (short-subunit alcohol dehydrogenase family)